MCQHFYECCGQKTTPIALVKIPPHGPKALLRNVRRYLFVQCMLEGGKKTVTSFHFRPTRTYVHKLTFAGFLMNLSPTQNYESFDRILCKIMLFMGQRQTPANCKEYRTHHFEVV